MTCTTGPYRFIVRGGSQQRLSMGDVVCPGLEPSQIKLFDASTGARL